MPASKKRTKPTNQKAPLRWDLSALASGDNDTRNVVRRKRVLKESRAFINAWKDRTDYLKDPAALRRALDQYEAWAHDCGTDGNEGYYFRLRTQQDKNSPQLKARQNSIEDFSRAIENDIRFFRLRIAKIPAVDQPKFLNHSGLAKYRHFLERVFAESRYHLSEPEERILNLKEPVSYENWIKLTAGFLAREERVVLLESGSRKKASFAEITSLMNSKSKRVRDSAAVAFNDVLDRNADAAEAEMNSLLQNKKTDDELRAASRPDALRHLSDDIDADVVDSLLAAVAGRFEVASRYYALKAKLMKKPRLAYHERNVEYGVVAEKYPYPRALDLVFTTFDRLDAEFGEIARMFSRNGQVDALPHAGKESGAFCMHSMPSQPTYILLNHTGTLHDVLTLAHEFGHGINNELMRSRVHSLDFSTPTSTAEVASTFMEDFVLDEILHKADDETRLAVMMQKLNDDVSTIFRQVACYRFEQDLHTAYRKNGYLSKQDIGKLFQKNMAAYMGKAVEQSAGSENWWIYWSHIRYFFYVYSYASGLLISKSLQNAVRREPAFIGKVKEFLSAGMSDSPRNIFLKLGIDIADRNFWNTGLDEVERLLDETETLARDMGKLRAARSR
jgi:oligoendopeptidase F